MTADAVAHGSDSQFGSSVMKVDARMHEAPTKQTLAVSTEMQADETQRHLASTRRANWSLCSSLNILLLMDQFEIPGREFALRRQKPCQTADSEWKEISQNHPPAAAKRGGTNGYADKCSRTGLGWSAALRRHHKSGFNSSRSIAQLTEAEQESGKEPMSASPADDGGVAAASDGPLHQTC